jgi:hypothetical protein
VSKKYKIETVKTEKLHSHNVTLSDDFSIFRYRPINDYTISALLKDELWATRPDSFNDPYDSSFTVNKTQLRDKLLEIVDDEIILNYGRINNLKPLNRKYIASKWIEDMYYQNMDNLKRLYLIACFSERIDNEAMWAHYSNNGTGFAIEYYYNDLVLLKDEYNNFVKNVSSEFIQHNNELKNFFPTISDTDFSVYNLYPVIYRDTKYDGTELLNDVIGLLPKLIDQQEYTYLDVLKLYLDSGMNIYDNKKQKTFIDSTYFLKKRLWRYEKEWRMLVPNLLIDVTKINQVHQYIGKIRPKAIYLGEYASLATKTIVYNYCYTKGVPLFQMKSIISNLKYNLQSIEICEQSMKDFLNGKY